MSSKKVAPAEIIFLCNVRMSYKTKPQHSIASNFYLTFNSISPTLNKSTQTWGNSHNYKPVATGWATHKPKDSTSTCPCGGSTSTPNSTSSCPCDAPIPLPIPPPAPPATSVAASLPPPPPNIRDTEPFATFNPCCPNFHTGPICLRKC